MNLVFLCWRDKIFPQRGCWVWEEYFRLWSSQEKLNALNKWKHSMWLYSLRDTNMLLPQRPHGSGNTSDHLRTGAISMALTTWEGADSSWLWQRITKASSKTNAYKMCPIFEYGKQWSGWDWSSWKGADGTGESWQRQDHMLMSLLKTRRGLGMGRWSSVKAGSNMGKGA